MIKECLRFCMITVVLQSLGFTFTSGQLGSVTMEGILQKSLTGWRKQNKYTEGKISNLSKFKVNIFLKVRLILNSHQM